MRLPRNVSKEVTRHGKAVYYFRRGKGARVRLPDIEAKNFRWHYDRAMEGRPIDVREMPVNPVALRKLRVETALRDCLRAARTRARKKRVPFSLTLDCLLQKATDQDFRCKLSGIEFFAKSAMRGKINPYVPSLDRIEPAKGYTNENVRIVVRAVNTMLLDWGQEVFEEVSRSYRYWQRTNGGISIPGPHRFSPAPEKIAG